MPQASPVSSKGAKYQNIVTTVVANENVTAGDLCVFVRGGPTDPGNDANVVRVTNPRQLSRRLCIAKENAVAGQDVKVLTSGHVDVAALTFVRPIEYDEPLVATLAGTLTNDAKRGDRIIAYSRLEKDKPDGARTTGRVFFDGITGFGAYQ